MTTNVSRNVLAWLPLPTPSSMTYSSSGSALRVTSRSHEPNMSAISSRTEAMLRASLAPPGNADSYIRPVAASHRSRACQ